MVQNPETNVGGQNVMSAFINLDTVGYAPQDNPDAFKIGMQTQHTCPMLRRFVIMLSEQVLIFSVFHFIYENVFKFFVKLSN